VHPDLAVLLQLQEKDKAVRACQEALEALEPDLAALDDDVRRQEEALEAARRGIAEAEKRRTELEEKIKNFRAMQERRRQRLEWVRGAKEAATLMAELDLGRSVLAKEEAEWLRSADRVQEAEARAGECQTALEQMTEDQVPRRAEIAALQAEAARVLQAAQVGRAKAAEGVPKPLLARYDRIRQGRSPLVVYPLHGDACGHCYTAVPRHRRQELQNRESIVTCEACGVMVFEMEPAAEA